MRGEASSCSNGSRRSALPAKIEASDHQQPIDCPYDGFLGLVCRQASFNFLLWHEEDIARSPDVGDVQIAAVKRRIDQYNQQRNDWIEKIDDWITERLVELDVTAPADAPQNTETLGSAIDRLSILALRIYHLKERDPDKLALAKEQLKVLITSGQQLADDLFAGRKRHKRHWALKMYGPSRLRISRQGRDQAHGLQSRP